jgi:hypothetical protein
MLPQYWQHYSQLQAPFLYLCPCQQQQQQRLLLPQN